MNKSSGFTLIEWLISCVIGLFLMSGAFSVYVMSKNNTRQLQIYNEMQENGRIAINLLENDLRLAGFLGDLTGQHVRLDKNIQSRVSFNKNHDCQDERGDLGGTFPATDIRGVLRPLTVRHVNNTGVLNNDLSCLSKIKLAPSSDVLVLKRSFGDVVSSNSSGWDLNRIYLATNAERGIFFSGVDKAAQSILSDLQIREYQHHIYFIKETSSIPELRLIQLTDQINANLSLPIVQGVERLRILIAVDESTPPDGITDKYLPPEQVSSTIWNTFAITGVQLFLLIRSLESSPDYVNDQKYQFADGVLPPFNDHFQRLVMQSSIQFRNTKEPRQFK